MKNVVERISCVKETTKALYEEANGVCWGYHQRRTNHILKRGLVTSGNRVSGSLIAFRDRFLLCSPSWLGTHYIGGVELELLFFFPCF